MLCSDEEIPFVEPVTKYKLKFSRDCGQERLIVQRIKMDSKYVSSPKATKKRILSENSEINNSPRTLKETMNSPVGQNEHVGLSPSKRLSMRKSVEKLNDAGITEMLCDSGSSVDSEGDDETNENFPQKALNTRISRKSSEARENWVKALRNSDLSSVRKSGNHKTSKTTRGSLINENDVDEDNKKGKEAPKKNISKIDDKEVLNVSAEGARRPRRKCKTKFDAAEWDVGSSKRKNNKRVNQIAMESESLQSSDEESLRSSEMENKSSKRRMSSRFKSKNVGSPNLKNNRKVNRKFVDPQPSSDDQSSDSQPVNRRTQACRYKNKIPRQNTRVNKNAVEINGHHSTSDDQSEDCQPLQQRISVSQRKRKSKGNGIECDVKETFQKSRQKWLRKTSAKAIETSTDSSSSDYEIFVTKQSVSCNGKKQNRDTAEQKSKGTPSKRAMGKSSVEEDEETNSDSDSPLVSYVDNEKVAMMENTMKGSPVKCVNKTRVEGNRISRRNTTIPMSPDVTCAKKHQNEFTPKHKLISSGIDVNEEKKLTPTTPSSRRTGFKRLLCTPSMPACKRDLGTPRTPLQQAMTKLHVAAVPQSLPCREAEFANVHRFLEGKILDGAGGCIYISGVPGTGKTATVREVVRSLKQDVQKGDLPDFQFIEINGMRLSHPRQAYVQLWKSLVGETVTAEQAQRLLESRFTKSSKKQMSIVLLVDEVDVLWTRRQDVVYNLLDWPTKAKAHLVVITIANTMDLPERLLMGRVTSRLGLTRLTFQPYTHKQLEEIVKARLEGINVFDPDAVQFVSRKVASVSGDARRALDICRRATEIAEQDSPDALVTIKHVDEAMLTMTSSHSVQAIVHACSTMERLFLQAVDGELTRTGLEETTFSRAYTTMETLCSLEGLQLPSASLIMKACMNLSNMRLLLCQHSNMDIFTRIFLNVSSDDLHYALKCVRKEL
ncbi:hypothetical protein R5R35_012086 [Gryllus longicercus]|uniref:Origin recognition complex subunit 1 n=1 Tax=Gryllus longicercus TaxID=2509291 RepID=A0AAN9VXK9_9ORTH